MVSCIYGIPSHIHSDKGHSFENEIIHHLCAMYVIKQTTTTSYNPSGNSQYERFNHTLFGLLKSFSKDEKANWLAHLPSMVFSYNATPHSTIGFQPYELMFGQKASAPCDAWLGLANYNDSKLTSKSVWVDQHLQQIVAANKQAHKHIKTSAKKSADCVGGKPLTTSVGNLVLLRDHLEGHNKIQDNYKSELFVVSDHHQDPNVYYITLLSGKGPVHKVNR